MKNLKQIGETISQLRKKAQLSQKQVAEYLSVDQSMISYMEKGERSISSDTIERLAELFCCPVQNIVEKEQFNTNCNISFRTTDLDKTDLKNISKLNKIVINQFEMDKIDGGQQSDR